MYRVVQKKRAPPPLFRRVSRLFGYSQINQSKPLKTNTKSRETHLNHGGGTRFFCATLHTSQLPLSPQLVGALYEGHFDLPLPVACLGTLDDAHSPGISGGSGVIVNWKMSHVYTVKGKGFLVYIRCFQWLKLFNLRITKSPETSLNHGGGECFFCATLVHVRCCPVSVPHRSGGKAKELVEKGLTTRTASPTVFGMVAELHWPEKKMVQKTHTFFRGC